ncbi:histone deacetylase family protein [Pseudoalteromonas sp. G4]|uniref:histone deacetylase family protein n=1 Tax=Pseudoalteromonas sp. G4 TaxID=2992761 RepID=UPI00237E1785|nr:histone deacetylase [Pseudoalteromonas sp. G4]MDE3273754.1 histone deacetylase [Pseudoalteromonas sp. G4]
MPIFYHPSYSALDLPESHRFPIRKYALIYDYITKELAENFHFITPTKATIEQIVSVHDANYASQFINGTLDSRAIRKIGFPWSPTLVERTLYSIGASIQGAEIALTTKLACQISGGYHHSYPNFGSGFCIFNDLVIAARHLIDTSQCEKVVILDLDVHQGDGSAVCAEKFDDIVTISMHCQQNFPARKQHSDYDFALEKHTTTPDYLNALQQCFLTILIEQPDIVLYNAGADIFTLDELGYFDICLTGVKQRDSAVINFCQQHELPLFTVSGGGYQRDVMNLVKVHQQLYLSMTNG